MLYTLKSEENIIVLENQNVGVDEMKNENIIDSYGLGKGN